MNKKFDFDEFIKKFRKEEEEMMEIISKQLRENPMCENCSNYFPGCCYCANILETTN